MRRPLAAVLAVLALLVGAGVADAQDATTIPVGGTAVDAVQGADRPAAFAMRLDVAERVALAFETTGAGLTARIYRPGALDAGLPARKTLGLAAGRTAYTLTGDWPGTWDIVVSGSAPAPVSITSTQVAQGTPGEVAGATTVDDANGMVAGVTYVSSTLHPDRPASTHGRFAFVQAEAGDRVTIGVTATSGRPLRAEAFRPGVTDASVDGDEPVAVLTTSTTASFTFDADTAGQWIVRAVPVADADGTTRPATFTATLESAQPRDPATTCVDDVTDIGLAKVRGCVKTGRNAVTATGTARTIH